jgi:hypothetical protein
VPALDADADETGLLENLEVLGDGFGESGDVSHDVIMKSMLN